MTTGDTASIKNFLRRVCFQSIDMDRGHYTYSTHKCELKVFNLDRKFDQLTQAHMVNKYALNSDCLDKRR